MNNTRTQDRKSKRGYALQVPMTDEQRRRLRIVSRALGQPAATYVRGLVMRAVREELAAAPELETEA